MYQYHTNWGLGYKLRPHPLYKFDMMTIILYKYMPVYTNLNINHTNLHKIMSNTSLYKMMYLYDHTNWGIHYAKLTYNDHNFVQICFVQFAQNHVQYEVKIYNASENSIIQNDAWISTYKLSIVGQTRTLKYLPPRWNLCSQNMQNYESSLCKTVKTA